MLFTDQLHHEFALAGAVIEIDMDDLLPGAQRQLTVNKWDAKRGSEQRCADMAVSVPITPARVMCVLAARRDDFVEQPAQIGETTTFILDGCQATGGRRTEDGDYAVLELALPDGADYQVCDIVHVRIAAGAQR